MGIHRVFANKLNITHEGSDDKAMASPPDVCKTGSSKREVAYPNTSFSRDLMAGSKTVDIEGHPVTLITSNWRVSTGDEAGDGLGVSSGTVACKTEFITASPNVRCENKPVVRHTDSTWCNSKNTTGQVYGTGES